MIGIRESLFLLVILIAPFTLSAQNFDFHFNFSTGLPTGEFGERIDHGVYGLNAAISFYPPHKFIRLGVGLNYFNYGWSNRSDRPFPERTGIRGRLRITNNILFPYLAIRIDGPRDKLISPYIEILGGVNYMYTQSAIESSIGDFKSISFDEMQLGYGMGAGLRIRLVNGIGGQDFRLAFVLNARYLRSPEINYLRENDLIVADGTTIFNDQETVFELIALEAGFVFQL